MKYSLCDQYWNKYDSFENIKDSFLFIQVNMQEKCLILRQNIAQNVKYDYIQLS